MIFIAYRITLTQFHPNLAIIGFESFLLVIKRDHGPHRFKCVA